MYSSWEKVTPQPGKQTLAMSLVGKVDFMLWGGSRYGGKTELLTMIPTMFCDDAYYRGIYFRNTYGEITGAGSLWDKAEGIYPLFDATSRQNPLHWRWPSGCQQYFTYMDAEGDKESHRGKGYSFVGFDEINKFSKTQITFMFTCLRSEAEVDATMIGTLNPDPDSWCLELVEWYLDEEGFPDLDKCGTIRYFIIDDNNDFIFADYPEWFEEQGDEYEKYLYVYDEVEDETTYTPPRSFTYIFFNIHDNPAGKKAEPRYLMNLNNLPDHERKTQLLGNWYAKPKAVSMWDRDWVRGENGSKVLSRSDIPGNCITVRGLDKAHTEPNNNNRYPDYTAISPKIKKDSDGFYYLIGDYDPTIKDPEVVKKGSSQRKPCLGRFRKGPGARDALITKQLKLDNEYEKVTLIVPKDSGGGKSDGIYTKAKLLEEKIPVEEGTTQSNIPDKKIKDFSPFANACQMGLVHIVEDSFDPYTLRIIYQELENFNGERSTSARKDDFVDAISIGFNFLIDCRKPYSTPSFNTSEELNKSLSYELTKTNILEDYHDPTKRY
jgi:phage terminase large subunit-like protein